MKKKPKKKEWISILLFLLVLIVLLVIFDIQKGEKVEMKKLYDVNGKPTIGYTELVVSDLEKMGVFYETVIGFKVLQKNEEEVRFTTDGENTLLVLKEEKKAPKRERGTTGLFHLALLLPERSDLAAVIYHIQQQGYPIQVASDHLYSEAIYLSDPEGNGIEIYRDKPSHAWKGNGKGGYVTDTLPMDIEGVMTSFKEETFKGLPEKTRMGHMHLQVASIERSRDFYVDLLGFDVMTEGPGMLFLSKKNYHHDIGLNTWGGRNLPAPKEGSLGLSYFTIQVSEEDYQTIKEKLEKSAVAFQEEESSLLLSDPSQNKIRIYRNH